MPKKGVDILHYGRIAAVGFLITAVLFSCGCSRRQQEKQVTRQAEAGGRLLYGSLQEPNIINPLLSDLLSAAEVGHLIFSGLVVINDKGEWIADLATEVPSSKTAASAP